MTRAVRVALIQPQAEGAGAQEIARLLDRGLQARGYEVHHVFFFRRTKAFDRQPNAIFCAHERPATPWSLARTLLSLFGHLRRLRPDVVLCFQHYGSLVGAPIARAAGIPIVIANWTSARELTPAWLQLTDRWFGVLGLFARVVTNSRSVTQDFANYPYAYRRRLVRIDHGFESKTCNIHRAIARARLNLPVNVVLLGCVARLHPLKNLTLAIKLLAFDAHWHLAIAGQGPEQDGLAALARELGCADRVHFLGELAPDRVAMLLSALDVFVFPSLAETFGLAVVEAAHAGVPVVANRLAVLEEVLSPDGEPCVLFADAGNPAAFAAAVHRLLEDTALAATLSARAAKLAAYYSREAMVAAYAALIESEVNGKTKQAAPDRPCAPASRDATPQRNLIMRLTIRLDPNQLRQWHLRLVQRLAQRPLTRVAVEWGGAAAPLPRAAIIMAAIECLIYRLPGRNPFAVATPADFALFVSRDVAGLDDVVLDLCGGDRRPGERTWHLYFDGRREESAAIGALVRSWTPVVSIVDATTGSEIVSGHPGVQSSRVLARAFDDVMARTATLVKAALDGATPRFRVERPAHARAGTAAIAWFWLKSMSLQALTLFYRLFYNTPHWRIGYRFVRGRDVVDLRAHPDGGWSVLADNGLRFYSDPFPVEKDGRTFLFLEDLEHRLNRGVISVVEFDSRGPIGTPRPVLDTGSHLSYPFVFEHGGEMWMVPESCSTATVDLYRAERFPDGWVKQATLVSGVVASDATLFEHDGRWWMFATVQDGGGSYSDALHVWSAPELIGPWTPHRRNPVLVDLATARPGGRVVRRGDKLIRPFQDCRKGYGTALGLAEIIRLDDDRFEQRVETILRPGPLWPGHRLHTLNRAGLLECIDGSAAPRRLLPASGDRQWRLRIRRSPKTA